MKQPEQLHFLWDIII